MKRMLVVNEPGVIGEIDITNKVPLFLQFGLRVL